LDEKTKIMNTRLYLSVLIFLLSTRYTYSQSTTLTPQGVMFPQLTTVQINALVSPSLGTLVYNTTTNSYWYRQSGSWAELLKEGSNSNFWNMSGNGGNEIQNTNSGGFWSAHPIGLDDFSDDNSHPPTAPLNGIGTRLMWIPSRSAFRVGTVTSTCSDCWDYNNIGIFSSVLGYNSKANGRISSAFGMMTEASGQGSTSFGGLTISSGNFSTAMGYQTASIGSIGTSMGYQTTSRGDYSLATGYKTFVYGIASTSMGNETKVYSDDALGIGRFNNDPFILNRSSEHRFLFTIGNGSSSNNRRNCFEVRQTGTVQLNHYNPAQDNPDRYGLRIKRDIATESQFWTLSHPSNENLDIHYGASGAFKAYVRQSDGAWMQSSDIRLKEQITPVESVLDKLKVSRYFYKTDTLHTSLQMGLIAQEVQPLFPEFITQNGQYYGVNYGGMSVVGLKAIQELKAENEKLKGEIQNHSLQFKELYNQLKAEIELVKKINSSSINN
jgi:Chaperone of endosialidase